MSLGNTAGKAESIVLQEAGIKSSTFPRHIVNGMLKSRNRTESDREITCVPTQQLHAWLTGAGRYAYGLR